MKPLSKVTIKRVRRETIQSLVIYFEESSQWMSNGNSQSRQVAAHIVFKLRMRFMHKLENNPDMLTFHPTLSPEEALACMIYYDDAYLPRNPLAQVLVREFINKLDQSIA